MTSRTPLPRTVLGLVVVLAAGFLASACLLTGLRLDADGAGRPDGVLYQATRAAWLLAAVVVTAGAGLGWWRVSGGGRGTSLLVGLASTAAWTLVALVAGWDTVR